MPNREQIAPIHSGKILEADFLEAYGLSQDEVADAIQIDAARIQELVRGEQDITAGLALRLERHFDTSPVFWMNLQQRYDLEVARDKIGSEIERDVQPLDG